MSDGIGGSASKEPELSVIRGTTSPPTRRSAVVRLPGRGLAHPHFDRYREWQWIKHTILQDYIVPWSRMLGSTNSRIFVVDAFAGAGRYLGQGGELVDGSPLIVGQAAIEYQAQFPRRRMTAICVERDKGTFSELSDVMDPYRSVSVLFNGDFVDFQDQILGILGSSPALVLLDPFGLKAITSDRCRPLLHRVPKTDVFVVVIMTVLHRVAGQLTRDGHPNPDIASAAKNVANITAFFDTDEWIGIALRPNMHREEKESLYLDLYFDHVLGKRYTYKSAYEVRARYQGPVKYWLVHASCHQNAIRLMNNAIVKIDEALMAQSYQDPGYLPGFGPESSVEAYRERLFTELKVAILDWLGDKGRPVPFGQLRLELLTQLEFYGKVKDGAYSKAVKQLVAARKVGREKERQAAKFDDREKIWLS